MDYDENNCPILPPLSDIIKAYSGAKAKQATYAPITRTDFEKDGFNFDLDGFQPEKPGPLPLAAVPSLIRNPPTTNPSASPTHNNLPQMIVPGGVALDHPSEEIVDIQGHWTQKLKNLRRVPPTPFPFQQKIGKVDLGEMLEHTRMVLQSSVDCL
jgi:hypothetical protein